MSGFKKGDIITCRDADDIKEKLMQNGFIYTYTQHSLDVFDGIAK